MAGSSVARAHRKDEDRETSQVAAVLGGEPRTDDVMPKGGPGRSHSRLIVISRERRGADRVTYLSPVRVMRGDKMIDGTIRNISIHGVLVTVPRGALNVGDSAVIRLMLPISGAIASVQGVATRVLPSRQDAEDVALHLSLVPEQAQAEIVRFVSLLAPAADDALPASF